MARTLAQDVLNNFSAGLVTQATGLNFPPNACSESLNCIHHELGYVIPRPGFEFEENYDTKTLDRSSAVVTTYLWKNATGDGTVDLLVAQVGASLYFYLPSNTEGFSAGALSTTVNLTTFEPTAAPGAELTECQFATGLGYLFVTNEALEPFYVSYNATTQVVTATEITVEIRDTEGLDDGLDDGERVITASANDEHKYNVRNQGWYTGTTLASFYTAIGSYPSNSEVWWEYKNFDDLFDITTIDLVAFASTSQAPKGHYILEAFNQDRTAASGIGSFSVVSSGYHRPSSVAFFSGRVWYGGVAANGFENKIYFSQILLDVDQAGKCYSREDPTSENFNQVEPDDGGWLTIPGIGLIIKLVTLANSLIVFGTNGVYQITGSTGSGFTALDYSTSFLSSIKPVSATNFVDVDGFPSWWTVEGIYILTPGQQGGLTVQSLTDQKIKDLYLEIPLACKRLARGSYDPRSHTVQWLYRDTVHSSLTQAYEFTNILNYNILGGAFYPWTIDTDDAKINSVFLSQGFGSNPVVDPIVIGTDTIIAGGAANPVVIVSFGSLVLEFANKFFVSYADAGSYKFTFADYANTNYVDWEILGGVSGGQTYTSTFTTGPRIPTQAAKNFQTSYLYIFSDLSDIENTDFYFTPIWNFANSGSSGKIPNSQRITWSAGQYFDVVRNRLKVRGSGYAVQYKFTASPGEPFKIIGWVASESTNSRD